MKTSSNILYPIYILWLRQLKRYVRTKSRIIGSLGQPVLFLIALGFGLGPVFEKAGGGNYIQFLAPGIISMSILFTAIFSGIEIIWDRQFGFLKETLVAPIGRLSIMIGRTLGGATTAFIQGLLVFCIALLIGFRPELGSIIIGLLVMFGISIVFTAIGTAMGSIITDMQGFGLMVNLVIMPIFLLSGSLFPLDTAPAAIRFISYLNPLTYGVDELRSAFIGLSHFSHMTDTLVLIGFIIVTMYAGAYFFKRIEA